MKFSLMKSALLLIFSFTAVLISSQSLQQKLDEAVKTLMDSAPAASANLSFYVADFGGRTVYDFNGNKGLSTASTQKIFTAGCALETLSENFRYTTEAAFSGSVQSGKLAGDLFIRSNGDPTLGSWRFEGYKPEDFEKKLITEIRAKGITEIAGNLVIDDSGFDFQTVPGGWPWNDMGNYYGAGVWGLNWRENQFDLNMNGKKFLKYNLDLSGIQLVNETQTKGSSDQSLIFTAPHSSVIYINGGLPAKNITISGAMPNPPLAFGNEVKKFLENSGISVRGQVVTASGLQTEGKNIPAFPEKSVFFTWNSPDLGKIIYWFLHKSINLYGETLIKTLAKEKRHSGSFADGVDFMKDFWKSKGIPATQINFADGSGLSPQNYVSAKAEVLAMLYAKKQPWFGTFSEGFPTQENGMKMKSGTMKNVKSYAGIHGNYVFSIIINNYQGADGGAALQKVLNVLK